MAIPDYSYHQPGKEGNKRSSFECSLPCLKFSLYCYNILLLMFGLAGLSVGLWTIIDRGQFLSLLTSSVYHVSGGIIIASGSIIILITVLGCCGISRESNKMILLYGCLLAVTVLIQCTIGVTAYFYKEQVHKELVASLNKSISIEYGVEEFNHTTAAMDDLQTTFKCCGAEGFEDWRHSSWWSSDHRNSNKVPDSCCKSISRMCGVRDHPSNVYYTGCAHKLSQLVGEHLVLIGSIAIVICAVESIGVFLSVKLVQTLKSVGD